jgi:protein XRP2
LFDRDKRPKLNPKDYTIENETDSTIVRIPGSVEGKQFMVQNCKDSFIYVLDHCSTVTVDDCTNCKIILGPTRGRY